MGIFKHFVIESSIEIHTTPAELWHFFYHLDDNYVKWHPADHHYWKWTKGNPLEVGAKIDSAETVGGHKSKIVATVIASEKNKLIALKPAWPISVMCPRLEWIFKPNKNTTYFIARTHYKFGRIFLLLKKKTAEEIMEITQIHMDEEGMNLKNLLEK